MFGSARSRSVTASAYAAAVFCSWSSRPERNRALSVLGAIAGAGGAVGMLLGGGLVQLLSWRWVFFVNVPPRSGAGAGAADHSREPVGVGREERIRRRLRGHDPARHESLFVPVRRRTIRDRAGPARAITNAAALELRPHGIQVALLIVEVGIQPLDGSTRAGASPEALADPCKIADAALFLANQDARSATHELQVTPLAEN